MSVIEAYVAELSSLLQGPRTVKADLLAEARDGLVDAAEAYQQAGLDEVQAEKKAVADFGPAPEIAADYQLELGVSQARRTGTLICLVLATQPLAWQVLLRFWGHHTEADDLYLTINQIVRWFGAFAIAGGISLVVAAGIGTRYVTSPRVLVRVTGFFAFAVCAVGALLGLLLTVLNPATGPLLAWSGLPSTMVVLGVPLISIAMAARHCIAATSLRQARVA